TPAMLGYSLGNQYVTKQIMMIGIDENTYSSVSDFGQYLQHPENRKHLDFQWRRGGYDIINHQTADPAKVKPRMQLQGAGWDYRKRKAQFTQQISVTEGARQDAPFQRRPKPNAAAKEALGAIGATASDENSTFDAAKEQHIG